MAAKKAAAKAAMPKKGSAKKPPMAKKAAKAGKVAPMPKASGPTPPFSGSMVRGGAGEGSY
jgi:hypothetical protein